MHPAFLSSLARWRAAEGRLDRWVSMGALALASVACVVVLLLLK